MNLTSYKFLYLNLKPSQSPRIVEMKQVALTSIIFIVFIATSAAFITKPTYGVPKLIKQSAGPYENVVKLNMGFGLGDEEPKTLTRENEPEDFFQTNTDKQTDEEKIPIALAGLAGISLPFILGLIALYASQ